MVIADPTPPDRWSRWIGSEGLADLPPSVTITLKRIGGSQYFNLLVDDEPVAEVMNGASNIFHVAATYLHTKRVRTELDEGLF